MITVSQSRSGNAGKSGRHGRMHQFSHNRWFRRLIVWGVLCAIYELAAKAAGPFFLPTLESIFGSFGPLWASGAISAVAYALLQLAIGFSLSVVVGVPLGLAMGASPIVDYVAGMYVKALFVTSLVAVLPLLIVIFGFGLAFRVAVVFLFAVFFIVLETASGVRNVDPNLKLVGAALCASPFKIATAITAKSALPFIFTGARLGLANAFGGMILAELWVARDLGLTLTQLGLNRDLGKYFALILLVTLIAGIAAAFLKWLEIMATPALRARRIH